MTQFSGQNKKKIDPRYFSEELLEEQLGPGERWGRCPPGFVPADARVARGDPGVCINNKGISRDRPKVVDTKAAAAAGAADWEKTIAGARKQVAGVEAKKKERRRQQKLGRVDPKASGLYDIGGYDPEAVTGQIEKFARAAIANFKSGKYKEAHGLYKKAYAVDPSAGNIYSVARAAHKGKMKGEAIKAYKQTMAHKDAKTDKNRKGISRYNLAAQYLKELGRRRSKVYAKGPTAGKIQGLLLKAFGVMAESKILSEANIRSVLGGRKIDSKIGPTTLKSLKAIPAIGGAGLDPADLRKPGALDSILKTLQKCAQGGFKDPNCKPRGKARPAASKAVAAAKTGDPAAIARALGGKEAAQAPARAERPAGRTTTAKDVEILKRRRRG